MPLEPAWKNYFSNGDFEWAFKMRQGDASAFFSQQDDTGALLSEKAYILDKHSSRHTARTPTCDLLLEQLIEQLVDWGVLDTNHMTQDLESLSRVIEPDFLLMDRETMSMAAGSVCFPSSWAFDENIGKPMHEIHSVVPQLNDQIGQMIDRFLGQLSPGKAYQRANWSFTRTGDLNYHPALKRPPLDSTLKLEDIYLRLEHQVFTSLPDGILMGLRIEPVHLIELADDTDLWSSLIHKLRTMPTDVAAYKSLDKGIQKLVAEMEDF